MLKHLALDGITDLNALGGLKYYLQDPTVPLKYT
jgi:hypothetical protein